MTLVALGLVVVAVALGGYAFYRSGTAGKSGATTYQGIYLCPNGTIDPSQCPMLTSDGGGILTGDTSFQINHTQPVEGAPNTSGMWQTSDSGVYYVSSDTDASGKDFQLATFTIGN